jgi:hypothetical protein
VFEFEGMLAACIVLALLCGCRSSPASFGDAVVGDTVTVSRGVSYVATFELDEVFRIRGVYGNAIPQ